MQLQGGGPDATRILDLLATTPQAEENLRVFTEMLFFNCLIGAPDAHAKNYSVILQGSDYALLAPFYDVASGFPYESMSRSGRLAMGIGGENRFGRMSRAALGRYARNGGLDRAGADEAWCVDLMLELAGRIEGEVGALFDELADIPHMDELRNRLERPLLDNCRQIARMLA